MITFHFYNAYILVPLLQSVYLLLTHMRSMTKNTTIYSQGPRDLNYSAVTFCVKANCFHQLASEGQEDACVLYSARRKNQEAPAAVTESGSYVQF